jgi:hypothetical protein
VVNSESGQITNLTNRAFPGIYQTGQIMMILQEWDFLGSSKTILLSPVATRLLVSQFLWFQD